MIDELAIYSGALTPSEIKDRYEKGVNSGIETIAEGGEDMSYTIVDAFSGIVMATAEAGNLKSVMSALENGVYIVVADNGRSLKAYKFLKK